MTGEIESYLDFYYSSERFITPYYLFSHVYCDVIKRLAYMNVSHFSKTM